MQVWLPVGRFAPVGSSVAMSARMAVWTGMLSFKTRRASSPNYPVGGGELGVANANGVRGELKAHGNHLRVFGDAIDRPRYAPFTSLMFGHPCSSNGSSPTFPIAKRGHEPHARGARRQAQRLQMRQPHARARDIFQQWATCLMLTAASPARGMARSCRRRVFGGQRDAADVSVNGWLGFGLRQLQSSSRLGA